MKWIRNLIRRFSVFNIIISKTTIRSLDLLDSIDEIDKNFKDKIKGK